jgi:hypothetical protein
VEATAYALVYVIQLCIALTHTCYCNTCTVVTLQVESRQSVCYIRPVATAAATTTDSTTTAAGSTAAAATDATQQQQQQQQLLFFQWTDLVENGPGFSPIREGDEIDYLLPPAAPAGDTMPMNGLRTITPSSSSSTADATAAVPAAAVPVPRVTGVMRVPRSVLISSYSSEERAAARKALKLTGKTGLGGPSVRMAIGPDGTSGFAVGHRTVASLYAVDSDGSDSGDADAALDLYSSEVESHSEDTG